MIYRRYLITVWILGKDTKEIHRCTVCAFTEEEACQKAAKDLHKTSMIKSLNNLPFPLVFKCKEYGDITNVTDKWGQKAK